MSTLTNAVEDAKKVAEITRKYAKHPLFAGLVDHFAKVPVKRAAKVSEKKPAKKVAKKQAAPRGKKGEWPAKIRAVLQEMPGSSAMEIIQALGFETDKSKAAHVRTVLSSLKKKGLISADAGTYRNTSEVLIPKTAPVEAATYGNAE